MTMKLLYAIQSSCLPAYQHLERLFDRPFGGALNPWRHLGALGFMCLWLLMLSGFYLYAVIDTSVEGAYRSIHWLTRQQWYLGGLLRSLHRYAADAFIVITLLHLLREWLLGRYHGFRRFSWLTGVPLVWFAFLSGIGGFWLNWDQLGQFSAIATAELLDNLPIFASSLSRNFLTGAAVSDRLFSLLVFIHIGVPLLMIFGLWFHVQRINRAAVFPPRALGLGTLAMLLLLALVRPVASQGAVDLARVPDVLALDWFYLFLHPLMYASSPAAVWALLAGVTLILFGLPFLPKPRNEATSPVAEVHPDYCNGCRRCFVDCPYAAIMMVPHPDGKAGKQLAAVDPQRCASCGICAGACPSSTPFRRIDDLITGIDMPQLPLDVVRRKLERELAALKGECKIVVFGCQHGVGIDQLNSEQVATISLICSGMLPPSFVEYALRGGAAGVLVTGCRQAGCAFRLGNCWTEERLNGAREPHLRMGVDSRRVHIAWRDPGDELELHGVLAEFRQRLAAISPADTGTQVKRIAAHAPL